MSKGSSDGADRKSFFSIPLTNYCANKYCGISNDTTENQMEDYLFVATQSQLDSISGGGWCSYDPGSCDEDYPCFDPGY